MRGLLSGLCDEAARQAMLDQVTTWWRDQLGRLTIHSPEKKLDNAFRWLQYQCQIVYVLNRMKSRFHTGYEYGWGFRDILQDVVFNLPYDPATVAVGAQAHLHPDILGWRGLPQFLHRPAREQGCPGLG